MRQRVEVIVGSWLFRGAATIILLGLIVWRSQPQHLLSASGRLGVSSVFVAAVLTIPFLAFKILRWFLMLRYAGSRATLADAGISLMVGMGLGLLTPARLGEVARVAYLPDARKLRLSGLVMLDKFFDVEVLVLLSVVGAWQVISPVLGALFALIGAAGLLFAFAPTLFSLPVNVIQTRIPLGGRTREIFSSIESLSPKATFIYLVLTFAAFAIVIAQFGIILHGAASISPRVAFLTFPLVILTNILPITIGGLGVREGASVLLLGHFHVAAALAAISAFTMFFLNTALPGLVGAFVPVIRRQHRRVPQTVGGEG